MGKFITKDDVCEILVKHGWKLIRKDAKNQYWQRPGKKDWRHSATFNGKYLRVFSTDAKPFAVNQFYSCFSVYAKLEHGGDFEAAKRALNRLESGSVIQIDHVDYLIC